MRFPGPELLSGRGFRAGTRSQFGFQWLFNKNVCLKRKIWPNSRQRKGQWWIKKYDIIHDHGKNFPVLVFGFVDLRSNILYSIIKIETSQNKV